MAIEFEFNGEQKLFRKFVRDLCENEFAPKLRELDDASRLPEEDIKLAAKLGLLGINIPLEYGGAGLGLVEFCILMEELSRAGCSPHAEILGVQNGIGGTPILLYGTDEQKEKYLPKLASGEMIVAFALTEPQAGSDAANIQLDARKDGEFYILNGTKIFITNGAFADIIITMAVTDKALGPRGGVTAFIVEKNFPGFSVGVIEKKMGNRASKTAELIYDNVRVPKENIIGELGAGFMVALTVLDEGRIILGAGALGVAKRALELASKFAKSRIQFGKPLAENEAIQWQIADITMGIRAAEYLVYHTAVRCEHLNKLRIAGKKVARDVREELSRDAAIVKAYCSELACKAIDKCINIHGAVGITKGHELERAFRDVRILTIYEGTSEIQRLVISKEILDRDGIL